MPAMPRPDNKGTKIAYKILGKPANINEKNDAKDTKIRERLTFEDTARVR